MAARLRRRIGFTIIVLLVVVLIIGILASIAITKFGASKRRAYLTAMKSDLRGLATVAESQFTSDNSYEAADARREPVCPERWSRVMSGAMRGTCGDMCHVVVRGRRSERSLGGTVITTPEYRPDLSRGTTMAGCNEPCERPRQHAEQAGIEMMQVSAR